jgi:hypothetical protein
MHRASVLLVLCGVCLATSGRAADPDRWQPYAPRPFDPAQPPAFDLRFLNESVAGEHGFITARAGAFWLGESGKQVRFWAVNGPPEELQGEALVRCARQLSASGVNLVRIHRPIFDDRGETDRARLRWIQEVVRVMKAEGIYTHLSVYFPLWFRPPADLPWLPGYDGQQHPFAVLLFHPEFQLRYRGWLKDLLTTPDELTGQRLIDDPAVFGIELQNEDSFFFWTFAKDRLPEPQLQLLERQFAQWLAERHGSLEVCLETWGDLTLDRDLPAEGRIAFRPLWNLFHDRTRRDIDTVAFLWYTQTKFYRDTYDWLRELRFRGMIQASNWKTADAAVLTPLEKLSYTSCDFLDRHGYFACGLEGEFAAWSIREDYLYRDRSSLRFDSPTSTEDRSFSHPAADTQYDEKPSIISETTYNRPNRFRSEAPLFFASYGALQGSDGIVHFTLDGCDWRVKPRFWMQPWTLASPAMLGQFPAAALIYRQGLVATSDIVATVHLDRAQLFRLAGSPLHEDAEYDDLRAKDLPKDAPATSQSRLSPLLHFVGRSAVVFTDQPSRIELAPLDHWIDRQQSTITSATGELRLDYARGLLEIDAPQAQGVSGNAGGLQAPIVLSDIAITSPLDLIHVVVVAMDGKPLSQSGRMLLQVMTEERTSGFRSESLADGRRRITNLGSDPWEFRTPVGAVELRREDAAQLTVRPLDLNGQPLSASGNAQRIELRPQTVHYLIEVPPEHASR